ncbi:ABC transporter ATP-binding protein [soil metagenome]
MSGTIKIRDTHRPFGDDASHTMSNTVIKVESLSKQYRLGQVGRKSLSHDLNRWWYNVRGKEDPYLKIGEANDRSKKGSSEYVWALQDINFEVNKGEVLGIIGSNGAGKSTLLKILSKVTAPTTGSIKVKGLIASLLEVGTGFHPDLSGRDNIFLNGAILGMTKKEMATKFDEIVDFAGVERYIDTPVKRYSSGMYVRLAFAVAAHLEPDILIVDEVLAVGDAEFQKKCLGKMKDVSERDGRTVLFVSHNMPAVIKLCTKGMVMEYGKTIFYGNTEDAVNEYLHHKKDAEKLSIAMREDRIGNGMIRCTDIQFFSNKMNSMDAVKSGDELKIEIAYTLHAERVRSVWFRLQILNSNEEIMFTCNNAHSAEIIPAIYSSGKLTCIIPDLPLFAASYFINLCIYSNDDGLLDEVEFAKELTVADGDFFGTGKIPGVKKGVFIKHTWQLD